MFFIIWPAEVKNCIYFNCLALTTLWITKIYPIHLKQLSRLISLKNAQKSLCFLLFDNTIVVFDYYIYGICFLIFFRVFLWFMNSPWFYFLPLTKSDFLSSTLLQQSMDSISPSCQSWPNLPSPRPGHFQYKFILYISSLVQDHVIRTF